MKRYKEYEDDRTKEAPRSINLIIIIVLSVVLLAEVIIFIYKEDRTSDKVVFSEYESQRGALTGVTYQDSTYGFVLEQPKEYWEFNQLSINQPYYSPDIISRIGDTITVTVRFDYDRDSVLISKQLIKIN